MKKVEWSSDIAIRNLAVREHCILNELVSSCYSKEGKGASQSNIWGKSRSSYRRQVPKALVWA